MVRWNSGARQPAIVARRKEPGGEAADRELSSGGPHSLDAPALILFTSGSTGDPKGVVHTHKTLRARWAGLQSSVGLEKFRRTLCLLPTHFGHGLICNCLYPWLSGQDLFILPPFKPEVVIHLGTLLDENGITFMSSVPTVWRLALKTAKPPRKGSLQRVFCGSAPLSSFLWEGVQGWTGTGEVFNSYGITETGSWVAGTTVPGFTPEDGLIGEAWGGGIKVLKGSMADFHHDRMRECSPGEAGYVLINTPALMQGYFGRDDLTRKVVREGWFVTGDIGLIDDRGWLYLQGRERDEINKGGMKVYPADIDAVVERFGKNAGRLLLRVRGRAARRRRGDRGGPRGPERRQPAVLRAWLRKYLGKHKVPKRWYLLDEIPRTSRGKVNRAMVAERCTRIKPVDLRILLR